MLFPVSTYLILLFDLINIPLTLSFVFLLLCGAFVVLVFVFLSGLSSAAHMIVYLVLSAEEVVFLALRVIHVAVLCFFDLFFKSFPGDDVLWRLLSRPLPYVGFSCLFFLLAVSVPSLFWFGCFYLVTTARLVGDQLM